MDGGRDREREERRAVMVLPTERVNGALGNASQVRAGKAGYNCVM